MMTQTESIHFASDWWHTDPESGKVVCTLCPRECHIKEGQRGFCFVRANVEGQLALTTYGRSSGFCIDPIEKKPLNHFYPGTPILSLGTAGCNLGCKFCQNWDISKSRQMDTLAGSAGPQDIVDAAERTGCRSIAFTYNDPVIWAEYAIDIAKAARPRGIKTVAVTAGYLNPEARRAFFEHIDAANIDLKAFSEDFYRRLTQTHLQPVLDTLRYLKHETSVWFELTTLIIPGENDSDDEIGRMCAWVRDELGPEVPMHFTAFHPDFKMQDKPRTPHQTLIRARQIALDAGLHYAYVGNVDDSVHQNTYCPGCGQLVIERNWFELGAYHLGGASGDVCGHCGTKVAGRFDQGRGDWGRKRVPIRIQPRQDFVPVTVAADAKTKQAKPGRRAVPTAQAPATPAMTQAASPAPASAPVAQAPAADPKVTPMTDENSAGSVQPRIDFDDAQCAALLEHARAAVQHAVQQQALTATLPEDLERSDAFGLFVTLKRGGQLRGCRGHWGAGAFGQPSATLGPMLRQVAADTATRDVRFPRVRGSEVGKLDLEVSLMHSPGLIDAPGVQRARHVVVGKHGLVLNHPQGRGLLLPQVATEQGYDAETFLNSLARKAGLPVHAWTDDAAQILTFEARILHSPPSDPEFDPAGLPHEAVQRLMRHADGVLSGSEPQVGGALGEEDPLNTSLSQNVGLSLEGDNGLSAFAVGHGKSLSELAGLAAASLSQMAQEQGKPTGRVSRLILHHRPLALDPADYPDRCATLAGHSVLAMTSHGAALAVVSGNRDPVAEALRQASSHPTAWRVDPDNSRLFAFTPAAYVGHDKPHAAAAGDRVPARAGQFYPADPAAARSQVQHFLQQGQREHDGEPESVRAVMLPHAGWRFCGRILGETLAHVAVPRRVIVVGPKHTPYGPAMSIPTHAHWQIPGVRIPIDHDLGDALTARLPELPREAEAHKMEHGTEVLLPFLHAKQPELRVLPLVMGGSDYASTGPLSEALAGVLDEAEEPVLLVISSDMNHFAPESEGRRRDGLALEAMLSGDPEALHRTCTEHHISMCGMLPAATVLRALHRDADHSPRLEQIAYTTSAEASGDPSSVVGYAGVLLR